MGRHSESKEEEMRKQIINLRARGFDGAYITEVTGYDKNTVYKYIKQRDDGIFSNNPNHALQDDLKSKQIMILDFDKDIAEMSSFMDDLKQEKQKCIANKKEVPRNNLSLWFAAFKERSRIKVLKWSLFLQKPINEVHAQPIQEKPENG